MFKINDIVSFKSNPMFIGVVKNINIRKNSFLVETSIDSNWHNENEIELITNMYKTQSEVETELDIKLTESLSPPELTISKTETTTSDTETNPYWENIQKMAQKQRDKGIGKYGAGLEHNTELDTLESIAYLQEELIDALMYCEHLKAKVNKIKNL